MKKNLFAILALAFAVAIAPSCSKDDDNTPSGYTIIGTEIGGEVTSSMTLYEGTDYTISSPLIVKSGATLTIEAGTKIYATPEFSSYVLILQGGTIDAQGTALKPITFSSSMAGKKWGGVIINGYAGISGASASGNTGSTEIASEYSYGGTDDADNSGFFTYIILNDTGANDGADVEHNGLTLNGVGNGTTINNIYVYATKDDGIEFFGGCVNVTNLLVVDPDDDMFDFTQGYRGTLTNAYGVWTANHSSTEEDPRGVEADGNLDGDTPDDYNQSDFTITNMTIVNNRTYATMATSDDYLNDAIKLRRGAKATMTNVLVTGTGTQATKDLVDLWDKKGAAGAGSAISVTNSLTTALSGSEINYGSPSDGQAAAADPDDFTSVVVEAGNTGCDIANFSWTGFSL